MILWVRVFSAHAEELSLVPELKSDSSQPPVTPGELQEPLWGPACIWYTETHGETQLHIHK